MKVLLSTGIGRLHLIKSAKSILKRGIDLYCIQGWVPKNIDNNRIVRLICILLKRDSIANGLKERNCAELKNRIYTCAFSEFVVNFLFLLSGKLISKDKSATIGWKLFGFQSKKYLKEIDILHIRSGAGQGGLINEAHKRGIKVLVDHSIIHPAYIDKYLKEEYCRNKISYNIGMNSAFWQLVLNDCHNADMLLVNSDFVKETFVRSHFPSDKIRVVYCGVDERFHNLKHNYVVKSTVNILFTGSFTIRKGAEYILKALKELDRIGFNYKMIVVGSYEKELLEKYPVNSLELVGHLPQEMLISYLSKSDIYLFPSLCEGCANSGMEALAAGLPVIATKQSGLPIQDGINGLIIEEKNVDDIIESVLKLSNDIELREKLGRTAAINIIRKYTWDQYAQNVISIYDEMMLND